MNNTKNFIVLSFALLVFTILIVGCTSENCIDKIIDKNEGEIYTLAEAYDSGLLSEDELKSILYYYCGYKESLDYNPIPKQPEFLSDVYEKKIKISYLYMLHDKFENSGKKVYDNSRLQEIHIEYYYGIYDNTIAIRIFDDYCGYADVLIPTEVGGIQFTYSGPEILIWKGKQ